MSEKLAELGLSSGTSREEFVGTLRRVPIPSLYQLRLDLFVKASECDLCDPRDILVGRKNTAAKSLDLKLSEDVWSLLTSIENKLPLPRILLKNGKRSKDKLEECRSSVAVFSALQTKSNLPQSDIPNFCLAKGSDTSSGDNSSTDVPYSSTAPNAELHTSAAVSNLFVTRELSCLRGDIVTLKRDILSLTRSSQPFQHGQELDLVKKELSALRQEFDRAKLLSSAVSQKQSFAVSHDALSTPSTRTLPPKPLCIQSWNCRGLKCSEPYIQYLAEQGADVVVLCEHWLWPYELHLLDQLHPDFHAFGVSDKRLNETSEFNRGCGGVAILWKKSLVATSVNIDSDRLCAIQLQNTASASVFTVLGAYMPSTDHSIEEYQIYLQDLEDIIISQMKLGPVLVAGDMNAHLGEGGSCAENNQGKSLSHLMDRCSLFSVTTSNITNGPNYTFFRENCHSLIDLILLTAVDAPCISKSEILDHHDLNNSDHLPVSVTVDWSMETRILPECDKGKVNWKRAVDDGLTFDYSRRVDEFVRPLIDLPFLSMDALNSEILCVASHICQMATECLPLRNGKNKNSRKKKKQLYIRDETVQSICKEHNSARRKWEEAGRPTAGRLFERRKALKKEIKLYIRDVRAMQVRKQNQKRDDMFRNNHPYRFKKPAAKEPNGNKVIDGGSLMTGRTEVLSVWEKHFHKLTISNTSSAPNLQEMANSLSDFETMSRFNSDNVIDDEISVEEIEFSLKKLKCGKRGGEDGITAEHLRYGGEWLKLWMKKIFNSVISSEQIPSCMKVSLIKPIYKGKGKNPLLPNSYRGISLSSTMGKALEYILLDRMRPVLQQNGSPHLLQTAYQQGVSCEDAVFATQEAALRVLREGGKAFLAFFDLEKAFDTIEFPVLLKCLFNAGVCGKAWRVIRSWYTDAKAAVEVDGLHCKNNFVSGTKIVILTQCNFNNCAVKITLKCYFNKRFANHTILFCYFIIHLVKYTYLC